MKRRSRGKVAGWNCNITDLVSRDSDESFSVPGQRRQSRTDPRGKENEADVEAAQETKVFGRVCSGTAATRVTDNNGGLSSSHRSQTATPSTYAARTVRALAYVQVQLQFTQPTYNRIPERFPCTYTLPIKSSASRNSRFTLCEIPGPGSGFYTESNYSRKQLKSCGQSTDIIATGQFHAGGNGSSRGFPSRVKIKRIDTSVIFKNSRGKQGASKKISKLLSKYSVSKIYGQEIKEITDRCFKLQPRTRNFLLVVSHLVNYPRSRYFYFSRIDQND
ncbi:hypothetical protein K0M31_020375 [Melipona bicolor]|uniref:Uncharacterized protein n=1 Tax=Melipona bicolor TaxID=60889 RepID=A0AA40G1B6_9HYME|nr:hypothetical protein K0M31_020375 [Melipona bicolor]